MRQMLNPLGALCVLLMVGLAAPLAALAAKGGAKQAAKQAGACGEVTATCERAGFARGAGGGKQCHASAAGGLEPERRDIFLQRCGAMLRMRGRFTDADVAEVTRLALAGLVQTADSAA